MPDFKIKEDDLMNYMRSMIVYAIRVHRSDVVNLLMQVGINVPKTVDDKTLHAIVLRALMDSETFANNFANLLHSIAMEGEHSKMDGSFANADAAAPATTTASKKTWSDVFSPETVSGLFSVGFGYLTQKLQMQGENGIKDEVDKGTPSVPQPPPIKKFPWGTVIGFTAALGVIGFVIYKVKNKGVSTP